MHCPCFGQTQRILEDQQFKMKKRMDEMKRQEEERQRKVGLCLRARLLSGVNPPQGFVLPLGDYDKRGWSLIYSPAAVTSFAHAQCQRSQSSMID